MNEEIQLNVEEFRKQLQPQRIRVLQIIYIALAAGVFIFFLIVLGAYYVTSRETGEIKEADVYLIRTFSIVHVCVTIMLYSSGFIFLQPVVNKRKSRNNTSLFPGKTQEIPPEKICCEFIATRAIIRVAALEGASLFGLIVCLLGSMNGTLRQHPIYWLNLFSFVILILYVLVTFPTRQRLEDIFQRRFGDPDIYQAV